MTEIRPADSGDLSLIAEVLEMASRGHMETGPWDLIFPEAEERGVALQMLAGGIPSWCHQNVFSVATVEGKAAAALCGFEPASIGGAELGASLGAVFAELEFDEQRMGGVAAPMATYLSCFPDMPDGVWIVENVGTRVDFRRQGLVAALLHHIVEEGRERGFATAQISCLIGNEPARFAYERVGFRTIEEFKSPAFELLLGAPGFERMTMDL